MAKAKSSPIKRTDIAEEGVVRDGFLKEIQAGIDILPVFEAEIKKFAKSLSETFKGVKNISTVEDVKKINAAIQQATQVEVAYQKVQKAKVELTNKQQAQAQIEKQNKRDDITLLKAQIIELDKTVGKLQRVEAANTRLRIERKRLNDETEEGKKRLKEINTELDRNNKYIIQNSDKLKQQKLNVGNYTESIKKAFEGTGILGETINKYLSSIVLWAEKIELATKAIVAQKAASEGLAGAQVKTAEATNLATVSEVENIATLEAQTAATVETEVATKGLGASLKALATNPYVIAVAAIAGVTKVIYDNVTAIQKNKDQIDATIESVKAFLSNITLGIGGAAKYAEAIKVITLYLDQLEDEHIANLTVMGKLRAEAAAAREDAAEDGKTTRQRIELLGEYVQKTKEAFDIEIEHAEKEAKIKRGMVTLNKELLGKESRELEKAAKEAEARVQELERERARSALRGQRMRTTLIEKYNADVLKMLQEAQRQEIESIDAHSRFKAEYLQKQLEKDLKLNQLETEQAIVNKKKEQKELGAIETKADGTIIDHTEEFEREILAIKNAGAAKRKELTRKTNEEIEKLNVDFYEKSVEAEKKFREDLRKLDEAYLAVTRDNKNRQQENLIENTQYEIDQEKNKVNKLKEQREIDIESGKEKYKLATKDLQKYFDVINKLEEKYYQQQKQRIERDSQIAKENEKQKTEDAITAVREKYEKQRQEDEKAIRDKVKNPNDAAKQIAEHNKDLADDEATEIERLKRNSAATQEGIDEKLKNDLTKNDRDHLKRVEQNQKEQTQATKDGIENRKKLHAEYAKNIEAITDGIAEGLQKRSEILQEADQRDIDFHTRMMEVQARLAAEGKENVLAEEQAAADRAAEKKIQDQKRAQKVEKNIALFKAFSETLQQALDKNKPFFQALAEASAAVGLTKEIFASLFAGSFEEGTEDTGKVNGKGVDGKGGRIAIVHEHERILTKEQNKKLGDMSNEEVANALAFENLYKPQFESTNVSSTQIKTSNHDAVMTVTLSRKIDELQNTIKDMPVQQIQVKGLREVLEIILQNGMTKKIHHKISGRQPTLGIDL